MSDHRFDVAIVGDSLGAISCAVALGRYAPDLRVVLVTNADWIGGQITNQGVPALDEHEYVERSGTTTASYHDFRRSVREHYRRRYNVPPIMTESVLGADMPLNPGDAWVSRLAFDPRVGVEILEALLPADLQRVRGQVIGADVRGERIHALTLVTDDGERTLKAAYYIDATDTGDLLPLTGTAYVTGAESRSDTGEADAPLEARPDEVQSFTFPFAVAFCAGEDHTIAEPEGYVGFRDEQPYTLAPLGHDGQPVRYRMFKNSDTDNLPFWSYRRVHVGALLGGQDISLINWVSNDYFGGDILNTSPTERQRHLNAARRLSLGFLRWLQTECPRDDGGFGYPEFKLCPEVMGTSDGLSQQPYIRESRRIRALCRVVASDISTSANDGARARHFADSGGIGWYAMDLHPCVGNRNASRYAPTRPFQIPLGALIPADTVNLVAACKNIGTTHLTNGAYRLHPVEWAIGEMAGTLAAYSVRHALTPADVWHSPDHLTGVQAALIASGCPVAWAIDVPYRTPDGTINPLFAPTQRLLMRDIIRRDSQRWHHLGILPDAPIGDDLDMARVRELVADARPDHTWREICHLLAESRKIR
ncbi:MAG: FAD-dependent oxidoreductase [Anaerolineaceae bacterium]|nr:MAG: FAD-dependent oxidoreductase [Anaerolineaceae bacterium]